MEELVKAIREERLLSYLHSYVVEQEDLVSLIGELVYQATANLSEEDCDQFFKNVADNLED